jgi:gamma-glutamyltranspeptidase
MESAYSPEIIDDLRKRGHEIEIVAGPTGGWGPISLVAIDPRGLRTAAADPRVDTSSALVG